jgi:para-aminobenzoate synthetase/4-amino-4-deoxychorismate lyase
VAIRTATIDREKGVATSNVGSGIVWDSRPGREYAECLAKARVLDRDVSPFSLIETLKWTPDGGFALLNRHLGRMAASARYFGIPFDRADVRRVLAAAVHRGAALRVRVLLDEDGVSSVETAPLPPPPDGPVRAGLARFPVDRSDPFLFHKTTRRTVYEDAAASRPDCDEVILWNGDGFVTETTIANIALCSDGRWVTPPISEGVLAGTLRAELLARGVLEEGRIAVDSLDGGRLAAVNAVRGWRPLRFVPQA